MQMAAMKLVEEETSSHKLGPALIGSWIRVDCFFSQFVLGLFRDENLLLFFCLEAKENWLKSLWNREGK